MTVTHRRPEVSSPGHSRLRVHRAHHRAPVQRLTLPPRTDPYAPTLTPTQEHRSTSWLTSYVRGLVVCDLVLGVIASVAAVGGRFVFSADRLPPVMAWTAVVLPFAWVLAVSLGNGYEQRFAGQPGPEEYRSVGRGVLYLFAGLSIVSFSAELQLSRGHLAVALGVLAVGALTSRKVLRTRLARRRERGQCLAATLVIGRADSVTALVTSIEQDTSLGLRPVAACASDLAGRGLPAGRELAGVPVVGEPLDAIAAVDTLGIEAVAVAAHPDLAGGALRRLTWALEERGVDLVVSPGLLDVAGPRMTIRPSNDLSLLHIERPAALRRTVLFKAVMDRLIAAFLLVVLSPVFLVVAALVRLEDKGPVSYRQQRVGLRGELFDILKFRSMRVGADRMLSALQTQDDGNSVLFKIHDDPRITRVGRVLRRYSIDELPQLVNVVRGEMSLVGPRPPLPSEVMVYESDAIRRLHVRPGMTGLWQVSGRSDLSWEESLKLDLRYVDNWSPVTDLWIMLRTARAVIGHSGAY